MSDRSGSDANPTARDRQQARADGRVACSREFVFALGFSMAGVAIWLRAPKIGAALRQLVIARIQLATETSPDALISLCQQMALQFLVLVAPVLCVIIGTVIAAHWVQHGPLWLPTRVAPNFDRIGPAAGAQRFSRRNVLAMLAIGGAKVVLLVATVAWVIWGNLATIVGFVKYPINGLLPASIPLLVRVVGGIAVTMLVVAAIDYGYRLWRHELELRIEMSRRDEIKPLQNDLTGRRR